MEKRHYQDLVLLQLPSASIGSLPEGTSLKTLNEAEEKGFIEIRGEFRSGNSA